MLQYTTNLSIPIKLCTFTFFPQTQPLEGHGPCVAQHVQGILNMCWLPASSSSGWCGLGDIATSPVGGLPLLPLAMVQVSTGLPRLAVSQFHHYWISVSVVKNTQTQHTHGKEFSELLPQDRQTLILSGCRSSSGMTVMDG